MNYPKQIVLYHSGCQFQERKMNLTDENNKPPLKLITMSDIEVEEVEWLWYPYIPFGKVTIVHGDAGEGKTTMILQLAALLSKGEKLPCDDTEREPVNIIYQTAEDGLGDTIKPRLLAGGADCERIKVIDETESSLSLIDERIEKAIDETNAKVIIFDPIQAYVGEKIDINRANEVRSVLSKLKDLAERKKCAVILIGHLNKNQGAKAGYRGLGSIDFSAAARSVLLVGRVKDNPEIRVICHAKSSLAPEGESIAFELSKENGFRWMGHYDIDIEDLLCGIGKEKKSEMAENLLKEMLSKSGYTQQEIMAKAKNLGISERVIYAAKNSLGVKSVKQGTSWYWYLPAEEE